MHLKQSRERGRPRGKYHNLADYTSIDYIGLISMKYKLDPTTFFNSLVEAWETQESTCENLSIECRMKTRDKAIFLITEEFKVIAQFPITREVLTKTNSFKEFAYARKVIDKMSDNVEVEHLQIKNLKVGMKGIKLKAKIMEISKPNTVYSKEGKLNLVANAKIADESGTIDLPLWNQQIETIAAGDTIQIDNAHVVSFRGALQLRIARAGKISVIEKD